VFASRGDVEVLSIKFDADAPAPDGLRGGDGPEG
jgi:hypothetical protein